MLGGNGLTHKKEDDLFGNNIEAVYCWSEVKKKKKYCYIFYMKFMIFFSPSLTALIIHKGGHIWMNKVAEYFGKVRVKT